MKCNLKKILQKSEMSTRVLSENSGVSVQQIMNIVNEKSIPKLDTAITLAKTLGIQLGDIWPGVGICSPEGNMDRAEELNKLVERLSNDKRLLNKRLDEAIEAMSEA